MQSMSRFAHTRCAETFTLFVRSRGLPSTVNQFLAKGVIVWSCRCENCNTRPAPRYQDPVTSVAAMRTAGEKKITRYHQYRWPVDSRRGGGGASRLGEGYRWRRRHYTGCFREIAANMRGEVDTSSTQPSNIPRWDARARGVRVACHCGTDPTQVAKPASPM